MAAVDGKIAHFFWLDVVHLAKYLGFDPTKAWPIFINAAFALERVIVDAPAVAANHAEIEFEFSRCEIQVEVGAIVRVEMTASSALLHAAPSSHSQKFNGGVALSLAIFAYA